MKRLQADSDRNAAVSSKHKWQDSLAQKMLKYRNAQGIKVVILGAVITSISLDKRDFRTDVGVRAIVFDVKEGTGTEIGVISQKNGHHFWVPSDHYRVTSAPDERIQF